MTKWHKQNQPPAIKPKKGWNYKNRDYTEKSLELVNCLKKKNIIIDQEVAQPKTIPAFKPKRECGMCGMRSTEITKIKISLKSHQTV